MAHWRHFDLQRVARVNQIVSDFHWTWYCENNIFPSFLEVRAVAVRDSASRIREQGSHDPDRLSHARLQQHEQGEMEIDNFLNLIVGIILQVKRTSFFTPNATSFARSAVATIGKTDDTSGYMSHQIQVDILQAHTLTS